MPKVVYQKARAGSKFAVRQYTDQEKADALAAVAANGGNVAGTAREIGIPMRTLKNWHDQPNIGGVRAILPIREQLMAQFLESLMNKILKETRGQISGARLPALTGAFTAIFDRWRVLKVSPTINPEDSASGLDLSKLSMDELKSLQSLLEKAGGSIQPGAIVSAEAEDEDGNSLGDEEQLSCDDSEMELESFEEGLEDDHQIDLDAPIG